MNNINRISVNDGHYGTTSKSTKISNTIKKGLNNYISSVAQDYRDKTLTTIATATGGAVYGAKKANEKANQGFTMLDRNTTAKTINGALLGFATGLLISNASSYLDTANRFTNYEKKFDETNIGKKIDSYITKAENYLKNAVGGGSY
ncbi:MAG: hypothetical protein N2594_01235 [Clostridiales bacterium]|nr:hypothetical protein [Clostridiales bacterium]